MSAPICDFVRGYCETVAVRLHMPGHKGRGELGCEALDITEVPGADDLACPEGIILESEENTTELFGSRHTFYSTGGRCKFQTFHPGILQTLYQGTAGTQNIAADFRCQTQTFC